MIYDVHHSAYHKYLLPETRRIVRMKLYVAAKYQLLSNLKYANELREKLSNEYYKLVDGFTNGCIKFVGFDLPREVVMMFLKQQGIQVQ